MADTDCPRALSPPPEEASIPAPNGDRDDNALDAAPPALVERLRGYVASAGARLLLDEEAADQSLTEALRTAGANAALARFVADARAPVLYLDSYVPTEGNLLRERHYDLRLDLLQQSNNKPSGSADNPLCAGGRSGGMGLAFIKRAAGPLDESGALGGQIQVISLGAGTQVGGNGGGGETAVATTPEANAHALFALLQQYTRYSFAPLVKALATEASSSSGGSSKGPSAASSSLEGEDGGANKENGDGKGKAPGGSLSSASLRALQKKITELELALAQCQKATEIPSVLLTPHPDIARTLASLPPNTDLERVDLEEVVGAAKLRDDAWLNALQTQVNAWVKDIQRVTRLAETTPFPDTALEEVNFWHSLDEALKRVQTQLASPGVRLTLRVLKQARRIIAVAALTEGGNTGVDHANKVVADILAFLRDLPLPALLSASSVPQLGAALQALFQHMGRLRHSKYYDLERAGKLLEALSRAFAQQVTAALIGTPQRPPLMRQPYDPTFLQTKREADALFAGWKQGRRKVEELFLDLWKKRRAGASTSSSAAAPALILKALEPSAEHARLEQRLEEAAAFRAAHARFRAVVERALAEEDSEAVRDLEGAYAGFLAVDALDTSSEGQQAWTVAHEGYEQRVDKLEARIVRVLSSRLGQARTAEEMLRAFARFNPLFVRPRIRAAVGQFQAPLIKHVRASVQRLQETFAGRYEESEAATTAQLRDLPPVAGKVLWARQIERELRRLVRRVEDVLGPGWEKHVEGRQLKGVCDELLRSLDTEAFFRKWIKEVEEELHHHTTGASRRDRLRHQHILRLARDRQGRPTLAVNHDGNQVVLAKEVRHLTSLGFRVPAAVRLLGDRAAERYPHALALQAALRAWSATGQAMEGRPEMGTLLAGHVMAVREVAEEAFLAKGLSSTTALSTASTGGPHIQWDSSPEDLAPWCARLSERALALQEKAEECSALLEAVDTALATVRTCAYEASAFTGAVAALQASVDAMAVAGYAHLDRYVQALEARLRALLRTRLLGFVEAWSAAFAAGEGKEKERQKEPAAKKQHATKAPTSTRLQERVSSSSVGRQEEGEGGEVVVVPRRCVHEIVLRDQALFLSPPLEAAEAAWVAQLHGYLAVVCRLPRLRSSRFDAFLDLPSSSSASLSLDKGSASIRSLGAAASGVSQGGDASSTFADLPRSLPKAALQKAYAAIRSLLAEVDGHVADWLQYQSLWDMSAQAAYDRLGDDVEAWLRLLVEMKAARSTIEQASKGGQQGFGPGGALVVECASVQGQVHLKYDAWQREFQGRFGHLLAAGVRETHAALMSAKAQLEAVVLDGTARDAMLGVTLIHRMRQEQPALAARVATLELGERLLRRQRYAFPSDWPQASMAAGALDDLGQILSRRAAVMEGRTAALQELVRGEDRAVQNRLRELGAEWAGAKPLHGDVPPRSALEALSRFDALVTKARADHDRLLAAKRALGLVFASSGAVLEAADAGEQGEDAVDDLLKPLEAEVQALREVWTAVAAVWDQLQHLRDSPWPALSLRAIRQGLDAADAALRALPNRVRQYEAFSHLQARLRDHQALQPLLVELKSDALKDRHWRQLAKRLTTTSSGKQPQAHLPSSLSELTLGHLWDAIDVAAHKPAVAEALAAAQGEMALEVFLRQVREHWVGAELPLAAYRGGAGRVRLIKGWDALFAKLDEHLNALAAMRLSPYFGAAQEFGEEAALWEDRLGRVKAALDLWMVVQKRWVYLEGIFAGSADLKAQLPAEHARFQAIDAEFVQLMRKVAAKPGVLDVLQLENLPRQLERQEALLGKVQRALGTYLKRQRAAFPRFHFVGDEDLLEVIGNGSEPRRVCQHLGKMFAGIAQVRLERQQQQQALPPSSSSAASWVISALLSKEGEEVPLHTPVTFTAATPVREWLAALEAQMRLSLAHALATALHDEEKDLVAWVARYPAQIVILALQVQWTSGVEAALVGSNVAKALEKGPLAALAQRLTASAQGVLAEGVDPSVRRKLEQVITVSVHQRDVTRRLLAAALASSEEGEMDTGPQAFEWLRQLRFYWSSPPKGGDDAAASSLLDGLSVRMADAAFPYGFEYLGVQERLVQTPLTDQCYLTLTQALHRGMGGNPFGPAGTGKTESVKALGAQLGRFVLVFNCDERFDHGAMGRLLAGLCQVGAWGCFDEFNRLEERILSAVSQDLLTIQRGLAARAGDVELHGEATLLHPHVGVFVTMNPGYAGRSQLPDNLKQLFRSVAMAAPDRGLIAQVMLFAQGLETAEALSGKIVLLFQLCQEQLSPQPHYDFGLRALKTVLVGAGALKRLSSPSCTSSAATDAADAERALLLQSACATVVPKLIPQDLPVFRSLLRGVFPGADVTSVEEAALRAAIATACERRQLVGGEKWVEKVLQLHQVLELRHGVMLVGPTASGKTAAWRVLLEALAATQNVKAEAHVLDPKALSKEQLYGTLDGTTLEWTDGVFTALLRRILANARDNEEEEEEEEERQGRLHWVVFDGDVDPDWAESLNSLLDDNRLLTLPSGERLALPPNVRILLEVDSLRHATPATVSRCGMVWFSEETVSDAMLLAHHLGKLRTEPAVLLEAGAGVLVVEGGGTSVPEAQLRFAAAVEPYVLMGDETGGGGSSSSSLVHAALRFVLDDAGTRGLHVMATERARLLATLFSLLARGAALCAEHAEAQQGMEDDHLQRFATRWLLFACLWGLGASLPLAGREALGRLLLAHSAMTLPSSNGSSSLLDLYVRVADGEWAEWAASVPRLEMESHRVSAADAVVPTTDTLRHVEVLKAWLASHQPLILCGPPGSGKSMTLTSTLSGLPNLVLAALNFASGTGPELVLKTLAQYCDCVRTPRGWVMQPAQALGGGGGLAGKWLVIFCDEVNLPEADRYGTQRAIAFLRQAVEHGGFWRPGDNAWVALHRVQFVAACNPPTDAGRVPLPPRFLRHAPVLLVDAPARDSLRQIYGTFNAALLKLQPGLAGHAGPLTEAMLDFSAANQARFTPDMKPQYVYSPRELSRWVRALHEAIAPVEAGAAQQPMLTAPKLVRLWAHEALRLFHDRLATEEERAWCQATLDEVAGRHFPGEASSASEGEALARPILFSTWLSRSYRPVQREELRDFVAARLKVFYEEELDVPLVLFDDVLEHVLRIDRVLRQPLGHLLLVGESGAGKTVLSRFAAWMNGLGVVQVKASFQYTLERFDEDLRALLKRAGAGGEKLCFIFDEANALSSAFLERMNALLASGDVPGLFEGDERAALLAACRALPGAAPGDGDEELYRRFVRNVQRNLHVVFTMNPAGAGEEAFARRCAASPALFNRCVVDWFGTWGPRALAQVAHEFTMHVDLGPEAAAYAPPEETAGALLAPVAFLYNCGQEEEREQPVAGGGRVTRAARGQQQQGKKKQEQEGQPTLRHAVVAALVTAHRQVRAAVERVGGGKGHNAGGRARHYVSPRDFLDLIRNFVGVVGERRARLEEQQLHITVGLERLAATRKDVASLQKALATKREELGGREEMANAKLQQMVGDQNEAERRKADADLVSRELDGQNAVIGERMREVESELAEAEPALVAAQGAVKSIKKAQLDEVRALARPPNPVRLTLEAVMILLNEGKMNGEWGDVRRVIRREDFIPTVVNFDPASITPGQIQRIEEGYCTLEEFEHENVNRASKACGPLQTWVVSLLNYARILRKVQPLREEVAALQAESGVLQERKDRIVAEIAQLEASIARYKAEYATSIRTIEAIKAEMAAVATKVQRAEALLESLAAEQGRWHESSASFQRQLASLVGDSLLAAAFLTYAGAFDHRGRRRLLEEWGDALERLGVPFRPDLSPVDFLTRPAQALEWRAHGLPQDQLCTENALVLSRCQHRYPLVVDPAGQATRFLLAQHAGRKVQRTSFRDAGFLKTLASAVRFGTPLLIEEVERVDPVLNPLLNREVQRTGGRTTVRVGNEDVDFSPQFLLVLVTRDPGAALPPDLCSRVTLVNFTVTPASLCAQALSMVLRSERPDVDRRRSEALRLQGEQSVRLRELEEGLLNELSAVQGGGSILDDDRVVRVLEGLKAEAAEVAEEAAATAQAMAELQTVSAQFEPLAQAVTLLHGVLERLGDLHFLYRFPVHYPLRLLDAVLGQNPPPPPAAASSSRGGGKGNSNGAAAASERLAHLRLALLAEAGRHVAKGLLQEDQLAFALRLAQIHLQGELAKEPTDEELDFLFRGPPPAASAALLKRTGTDNGNDDDPSSLLQLPGGVTLDAAQVRELKGLALLPSFGAALLPSLQARASEWAAFLAATRPETAVPEFEVTDSDGGSSSSSSSSRALSPERRAFLQLLLVRALRRDRLLAAMEGYVTTVLGDAFPWRGLFDLGQVVAEQGSAASPLLLCSEPGHDASQRVEALAAEEGRQLLSLAMGAEEGNAAAERLIATGAAQGSWVLLRNIHLCPAWLRALEARLHHNLQKPDPRFRLFLTAEIHPKLPAGLLRLCEVMVLEAPAGMKANLLRLLHDIPPARMRAGPAASEKARLFALVAWFHALVQERLRYLPLGWSRRYEFAQADAHAALDAVEGWVGAVAGKGGGRAHVAPEEIPWAALQALLAESIYGGRVDNAFDQAVLEGVVARLFCPGAFDADFSLTEEGGRVSLPEGAGADRDAYLAWAERLPNSNPPTWLGLAPTVEAHLLGEAGLRVAGKAMALQPADVLEAVAVAEEAEASGSSGSGGSKAKKALLLLVDGWLGPVRAVAGASRKLHLQQQQQQQQQLSVSSSSSTGRGGGRATRSASSSSRRGSSKGSQGGGDDEEEGNPVVRCLRREAAAGGALLCRVEGDLAAVQEYLTGATRGTNTVRALVAALGVGRVPSEWRDGAAGARTDARAGAGAWVLDVVERVKEGMEALRALEAAGEEGAGSVQVWLGGLFYPEAFITATRQLAAQRLDRSLEELALALTIASGGETAPAPADCVPFAVRGLWVEGAAWEEQGGGRLSLSAAATVRSPVPLAWLCWRMASSSSVAAAGEKGDTSLVLPVYADDSRAVLVGQVRYAGKLQPGVAANAWAQRGVAVVAWRGVV